MIGWIFLGLLALVILVCLFLRLGVLACYDDQGPWVKVRVGGAYIQVYPLVTTPEKEARKKRKKEARAARKARKAEKKAAKGKAPKKKEKPSLGGLLSLGLDLLPVVTEAAGTFRRKLQIDRLELRLTWGEEDPADAAIHYGYAWAAAEAILAHLEAAFVVKEHQVEIQLDFDLPAPRVYVRAGLSLTLGQLLAIGLRAGGGALKILLERRKTRKQTRPAGTRKGEASNGKKSSCE